MGQFPCKKKKKRLKVYSISNSDLWLYNVTFKMLQFVCMFPFLILKAVDSNSVIVSQSLWNMNKNWQTQWQPLSVTFVTQKQKKNKKTSHNPKLAANTILYLTRFMITKFYSFTFGLWYARSSTNFKYKSNNLLIPKGKSSLSKYSNFFFFWSTFLCKSTISGT